MRNKKRWRVRVLRKIEDWVDVVADSSLQAESIAATMPQIISVFGQSAIPADKPVGQVAPIGVVDDEE